MEFIINTKTFIKYVTPAADIALKNAVKYHSWAGLIKISTYPNIIEIDAYGGSASVTVKIRLSDGYEYNDMGNACVQAKELSDALKSFPPTEDIVVCICDGKLMLFPVSDENKYIKIPLFSDLIEHPKLPEEYDEEVTVNREYFIKGLQQVKYAPAKEVLFSYMSVLFESSNNTLKFSAGNGGRFTVVEYIGNGELISSGDIDTILPKTNISNIIRIFKKESCSTLDIKMSSGDPTENIPEQLVIEADNITLRIYGLEYFTKYPVLTKILNNNYTYQIPTKVQDWKYAAEAIAASKHSCEEHVHNIKVMADIQSGHFDLQPNTLLQMNINVHFKPEACVTDTAKEKSYKPWFCCNACYLCEMAKKNKNKTVILNFEDQAKLDEIPDDQPKQIKPVLLRFPDEVDKNGVTEKSVVFFTVSTKWDDKYLSQKQEAILSRFEILDLGKP